MTRDLEQIVECLKVTESELGFQIGRLARTSGSTEDERDHLADLVKGYSSAAHYIGILRRYQEGRLSRGSRSDEEADDAFAPNTED